MPFIHAAAMFVAAFFAGVVNSIAGGGMLLTFPLLIWLGLDPKVSNATCTVALWPGLFGGLFGYRREMNDSSLILMRLGVISVIGGGVGAWLLIATPAPMFARLVPFLILFATIRFMAAIAFHGGRRARRWLLWRTHRAARGPRVYSSRDCGDRICDYDRDAVENEVKPIRRFRRFHRLRKRKPRKGTRGTKEFRTSDSSSASFLLRLLCLFVADSLSV